VRGDRRGVHAARHRIALADAAKPPSATGRAAAAGISGAFGLGDTAASFLAIDPYHILRIMIGLGDDLPAFAAKVGGW
jgi:hypothetical protein